MKKIIFLGFFLSSNIFSSPDKDFKFELLPETQLLLLKFSIPLVALGVDKMGNFLKRGVSDYLDNSFNTDQKLEEPFSLEFDLLDKGIGFKNIFDPKERG